MTALPSQLSYGATPADSTAMVAADVRNPLASILTTVNTLISVLSGGSSGQVLKALSSSSVDWSGGTYAAYSPAWTSTGVAPVIGNGTVAGRFTQMGKLVQGSVYLTIGTTTTLGTGNWLLSLPAATGTNFPVNAVLGGATANNGAVYPLVPVIASGTTVAFAVSSQPVTVFAGGTVPFSWVATNYLAFNFTYEAA